MKQGKLYNASLHHSTETKNKSLLRKGQALFQGSNCSINQTPLIHVLQKLNKSMWDVLTSGLMHLSLI